jgi:phosphopantothenoylcysteine decarboxylase/phosphopantothenate--cysteine ligase|tara:strand:- start:1544 stop:2806 length:1263 start_codon:yes stop_codon:yes gene_type:complete
MVKSKNSSVDFRGTLGDELKARKIALCMTGSVAAVKSPEIARELIRYGADVSCIMSDGVMDFIQPMLMEWASQNDVITKMSGRMEHIQLIEEGPEKIDLLLIAPATANTLSKIASGISDTPVTLLASSALGSGIPIVAAPSMHSSLWSNSVVKENLDRLRTIKVDVLTPQIDEGKAKITSTEVIVDAVIRRLTPQDFSGIRVFVTAGPTYENIDPIRIISNKSSGKMGFALAREAWRRGADVTLVSGPTKLTPPVSIDYTTIVTTRELYDVVKSKLNTKHYDLFLAAAAVGDFRPVKAINEKMSSRLSQSFNMKFETTEKVIHMVKKIQHDIFLLPFKVEWSLNHDKMIERAKMIIHETDADLVAVNDASLKGVAFDGDTNQILLLKKDGDTIDIPLDSKQRIASRILDVFIDIVGKHHQ